MIPGSSAALSIHRGSIVASHLSIPRDIRKASVVEGVIDEEREGMAPMINVLKEMVNYEVPNYVYKHSTNISHQIIAKMESAT